MTNSKTGPIKAEEPSDGATAPSESNILTQIEAIRDRIGAIGIMLRSIIDSEGKISFSGDLSEPFGGLSAHHEGSIGLSEGINPAENALPSDNNALLSIFDALTNEINALIKVRDALTNDYDALLNKRDALTNVRNTLIKKIDALTNADKSGSRKFKHLPWEGKRRGTYHEGGKPRYNLWWRQSLPAALVEKVRAQAGTFGGMRTPGHQAVAGIYLVLYFFPNCSRTDLTGRLQLHPDHVKRYLSRMRKAGHLLSTRISYEHNYTLTEKGREWVEGDGN